MAPTLAPAKVIRHLSWVAWRRLIPAADQLLARTIGAKSMPRTEGGRRMRPKLLAVAMGAALVVSALAAALILQVSGNDNNSARPSMIISEGAQLLPSDTLTDWVTYGDHL